MLKKPQRKYAIIEPPKTCKNCERRRQLMLKIRKHKHLERKAKRDALIAGIASGSVIVLYECDEFTGLHYRVR